MARDSLLTERHGPGGPAGLQNSCGRATHGSVGSTPAPLRSRRRRSSPPFVSPRSVEQTARVDAVGAAKAVVAALHARDWDALEALFHPQALLHTQAGGDRPLSGRETLRALQRALRDGLYEPRVHQYVALDAQAVALRGTARYRRPEGGFADSSRCWLYVFRDGLLFRSRMFSDAKDAHESYARLGPDLGLVPEEPLP